MDILSVFKTKKKQKDFFLALLLKPFKATAILFEEIEGKLTILATKDTEFNSNINELSEDDLINSCDEAISSIEENLPDKTYVQKTIFSVPYNWTDQGKIKKHNLSKLKKLCDELELVPLGFIVNIEAIIHYLHKKEGAPVSGVFVEITKNEIIVYIVRADNIIDFSVKDSFDDITKSVENALKEIKSIDVLPSKIVLFEYEDIHHIQQEFLSFPWKENLPFLHLPQVTILEAGVENEAVINGVASQMGFDLLENEKEESKEKVLQNVDDKDQTEDLNNNFGFLKNEDVKDKKDVDLENKSLESLNYDKEDDGQEPVSESFLGKNMEDENNLQMRHSARSAFSNKFGFVNSFHSILKRLNLNKISTLFGGIKPKDSNRLPLNRSIIIITVLFFIFIGLVVFIYYYLLLKVNIVIFLDKTVISESSNVILSQDNDTSADESTLKIELLEIEEQDEQKTKTTGKKETGDKAKGEITIYNKTEQKKTFSKGTIVSGPANREFELLDEVNIASTSAFSTTLSNVKVKVQASNFGTEYNLPSETNFTFKEYPTSDYFAKNPQAFEGGTKKELEIVSQKDLDNLLNNLSEKLKEKSLQEMKTKITDEDILLPFIISTEILDKKYDKKEDEEAKEVKLSLKIKFTGAYYKKKEIEKFTSLIAKDKIPENFYLDTKNSISEIKNLKMDKNDKISATFLVNSIYLPKVDTEKVRKEIEGKDKSFLEEKIKETKGIVDYNIVYENKIDLLPERIPFNYKNINLSTSLNLQE